MKKVAIITSGIFPVPPTKGGAVENLIQMLSRENNLFNELDLTIFSIYDDEAKKKSKLDTDTDYRFVKIPLIIRFFNIIIYFFFSKILRKKKVMSYRFIGQRIYYIISVAKAIHNENYDVLILENHPTLFLCIKLFGNYSKYKNKYIYHMHNKLNGFYGCQKIIENTSLIMGVSQYILNVFKEEVPNYSKKMKFEVLRNKVDLKRFRCNLTQKEKSQLRIKLNLPPNKKIILFSGRMNKEKGIDKLLLAWKGVNKKDAILLIVGSYYYKSGIKNDTFSERINTLIRNQKNIYFTGYVDYDEMPKIYSLADLVVLPSIWEDPAPLTVIESLTSGCPLITTNSGGIPEYINPQNTILLKKEDPDFPEKLADKINFLLSNPNQLVIMQNSALKFTQQWDTESYYKDFIKIINKVI